MAYIIKGNKVFSDALEVKAVDQCNLSCVSCNEMSPISSKKFPDLTEVNKNLKYLANFYHAKTVRVLGGEPLIRKDIVEFVKAIRSSGISDSIRIMSNGSYLDRFTVDLLDVVDSVDISIYPGVNITIDSLYKLKEQCAKYGVDLYVKKTDFFHLAYSEFGTSDQNLINRVYKTCKIVHLWGCQSMYDGHFFKCFTAPNIDRLIHNRTDYPSGLSLQPRDNFFEKLVNYLNPKELLPACASCLGTVGKKVSHSQVGRSRWRELQNHPSEGLIDYEYLAKSEIKNDWEWEIFEKEFEGFESGNGIDGLLPLGVFPSD